MIKKHFLNILRWGLRLHGISHFIEVISAINEEAYITATIAFIFIVIEILASFFIPNEHIHFKPIKSEVHTACDEDSQASHKHIPWINSGDIRYYSLSQANNSYFLYI